MAVAAALPAATLTTTYVSVSAGYPSGPNENLICSSSEGECSESVAVTDPGVPGTPPDGLDARPGVTYIASGLAQAGANISESGINVFVRVVASSSYMGVSWSGYADAIAEAYTSAVEQLLITGGRGAGRLAYSGEIRRVFNGISPQPAFSSVEASFSPPCVSTIFQHDLFRCMTAGFINFVFDRPFTLSAEGFGHAEQSGFPRCNLSCMGDSLSTMSIRFDGIYTPSGALVSDAQVQIVQGDEGDPSEVPEPAPLALLTSAAAVLLRIRRHAA